MQARNVTSLKVAIMEAFQEKSREQMKQAYSRFKPRMETVIEAGDGYTK